MERNKRRPKMSGSGKGRRMTALSRGLTAARQSLARIAASSCPIACRLIAGIEHGADGRCYLELLGRAHADLDEEGASETTILPPAIAPHHSHHSSARGASSEIRHPSSVIPNNKTFGMVRASLGKVVWLPYPLHGNVGSANR